MLSGDVVDIGFRLVQCVPFFFNCTSTTEIYTYRHTLSLHDALPISGGRRRTWAKRHQSRAHIGLEQQHILIGLGRAELCCPFCGFPISKARRSEEHTSELQSLMRLSYAVFCLKKTQYRNYKTPLPQQQYTKHY